MMMFFALFWLGFVGVFTFVFMGGMFATEAPFAMIIFVAAFLSIFWFVGITLLRTALKEHKKNKETELYGVECYARTINVYESGTYVNDNPEYKADFILYVTSTGEVQKVSEVVGYNYNAFKPGTTIKGKYYNGDINFDKTTVGITLPYEAENKIKEFMVHYNISEPTDVVVINGVEYVRKN